MSADSRLSSGRLILLTGVSQGLGRAMTELFIRHGHQVAGCCRSADTAKELSQQFGHPHRFDTVDVSNDDEVKHWAESVIAGFGVPELLINNAAVINSNAKLWTIPAEEFDHLFSINVCGTANVIRHFLPPMLEASSNESGTSDPATGRSSRVPPVIVNFSSGWGRCVSADVAPYCASKWAIEGLTQALAEELPRGCCAVPLNPGIINTPMLQSCFASGANLYPTANEWAERAVPFILNLNASHNGQPLTVPEA